MNSNSEINIDNKNEANQIQFTKSINNSTMGVVLSTREVTNTTERDGKTTQLQSSLMLPERPWTLETTLLRPSFVTTIPWPATATPGTVLASFRIPHDLLTTSFTSYPFKSYMFWRGNPKLSFQVIGSAFHQGLVAAVFVPLSEKRFIDSTIAPRFSALTVNQTNYMYANANTASEMYIRYNSPLGYINLSSTSNSIDYLGYVYIVVLNKLDCVTGTTPVVNISLFSQLLDSEFKVPRTSTLEPQGGKVSTINNWNNVSDVTMPMNMTGDKIDATADVTAMDNPTFPINQPDSVVKPVGRLNYAVGPEYLDKLVLYPSAQTSLSAETFATDVDEMSFDVLKRYYTYLTTLRFNTTDKVGTSIWEGTIDPFTNLASVLPGKVYEPTLLGYLSYPFQYWRGGITFKFQVIATSFQTGKLFFACNFGTLKPNSGDLTTSASQYGAAFEINQGTNEFEYTIPYVANTPYKSIPNSSTPNLDSSSGIFQLIVVNPLVAPNNSPVTIELNVFVAGAPDFEVAILGNSNNFVPLSQNPPVLLSEYPLTNQVVELEPQSTAPLMTTEVGINESEGEILSPSNTVVTNEVIQYGHRHESMRDFLRKYQLCVNKSINFLGRPNLFQLKTDDWSFEITELLYPAVKNGLPDRGLFSWGIHLYRQIKGSLRFKFEVVLITPEFNYVNIPYSIYFTPYNATQNTDINSFPALLSSINGLVDDLAVVPQFGCVAAPHYVSFGRQPITRSGGITPFSEFEIPFTPNYITALIPSGNSEPDLPYYPWCRLGKIIIVPDIPPAANESRDQYTFLIKGYIALGDETRCGTVFNIPSLVMNSFTSTPTGKEVSIGDDLF